MTVLKENVERIAKPLRETGRFAWLAGLGVAATGFDFANKSFNLLVERGKTFESEKKPKIEKFGQETKAKAKKVTDRVEDFTRKNLEKGLAKLGIPTREEIQNLTTQVENLTAKLREQQA
ncbi:MAG: phasin family protein [Acidobacteria bacterium]|nr:phasin family protein [Acidobacteriota bacterium]MCB9397271.1 phasin family protein [Acidobacteriota bacterium]